jgi:hypothetical protein
VRTASTDSIGGYNAPDLPLGNYEVRAQQPGFQTEVRIGIALTVGREAVVDLTLKVGQISERVLVTGEAPLVEVTTSAMSALVDERTIRDRPLNGRSYDQLALFQPGVVTMGAGQASAAFDFGTGARFSVTGSRAYANSFLLDGTDINDHANGTPGGAAGTNPGVDGVQEFKINTSVSPAEYGRSSGGTISAVTRSGTNGLQGILPYTALQGTDPKLYNCNKGDTACMVPLSPVIKPYLDLFQAPTPAPTTGDLGDGTGCKRWPYHSANLVPMRQIDSIRAEGSFLKSVATVLKSDVAGHRSEGPAHLKGDISDLDLSSFYTEESAGRPQG